MASMRLPLAEIEHRLSSVPGGPTRGWVWRTLVAAFWRGDLHADNWTREQLREKANLDDLTFDLIATQVARRGYHPEFRERCLDKLMLDFDKAQRCVLGTGSKGTSVRPGDDNLRQRITKVLDSGHDRVEQGASFKSVAGWLTEQKKSAGFSQSALEKILSGRYGPMNRLDIDGLKGD